MKALMHENEDGKFFIFPNDGIGGHLLSGRLWEPHFREIIKLINQGDYVIDCGANFGYNTIMMAKQLNGTGKILAYEPQKLIYQQLNANLFLNDVYNVESYRLALSNVSDGIVNMSPIDYEQDWVNIGDLSVGDGGEEVKTIKLDDLEIPRLDFIKMDVQGYEPFVLEGSRKIIEKYKPYIFIEIEPHQLVKFNKTPTDIINGLKDLGYRMFLIENEWPYDYICTMSNVDKLKEINLKLKEV